MGQPLRTEQPLETEVAVSKESSVGSLVRRLAVAGLLLAGLTALASIALAF
jgi:hypothetical protein